MLTNLGPTGIERQELIVSGYVRLNYNCDVPEDISKLCHLFCNEIISASVSIDQLLNMEEDDEILLRSFLVRECEFGSYVEYDDEQDYVLWIRIKEESVPKNMCDIEFYYEFCCKETKYNKNSNKRVRGGITWHRTSAAAMIIHEELFTKIQKQECIKSLSFQLYVDMLYAKYDDDQKDDDYNLCKLSRNVKFDWIMNKTLYQDIEDAEEDEKFYSNNFGLNKEHNTMNWKQYGFCLLITKKSNDAVNISLRQICLPKGVGAMRGEIILDVDGETRYLETRKISFVQRLLEMKMQENMKLSLTIKIETVYDIATVYGQIGSKIPTEKWKEYDIIL